MSLSLSDLAVVVLLLVLASLVAVVVEKVRVPYTVVLIVVGVVLPAGALGLVRPTALSPNIVLGLLLPPLLFEAAFSLRWGHLAPVALAIFVLSTVGVVFSAVAAATVLVLGAHLPWSVALLFGALIAATDPVAVVAFFQRAQVVPELRALVEGESLVNDGTAVVLVGVVAGLLTEGRLDPASAAVDFLRLTVGGLAVGTGVGFIASVLARGTSDYLVEATLSVAAAYGSYLLGEQLHLSGVLAVVCAGSVFGNFGRRFGLSPTTDEAIDQLWRFLAFVANSLVFLLLGLAVDPAELLRLGSLIVLGVVATLAGRAVVAYGLGTVLALVSGVPELAWRHVLFLAGLRGALPVVVAITATDHYHVSTILRDLVLAVVVVTLLVQGLTLNPILTRVLLRQDKRATRP